MKLKDQYRSLPGTKKTALGLVILAVTAVIAGDPYRGHSTVIDAQELAMITQKQVDHVTAEELAGWIIMGKQDYRLIDLRTPEEYTAYHIPGSENCQLTDLTSFGILPNEKIVLASQGMTHAAQGWFLLKAREYSGVYILFGGVEAWTDEVLLPKLSDQATAAEKAAFERKKQVAAFFGGTPMIVSASGEQTARPLEQQALSKPKTPMRAAPPVAGTPAATAKKKKEGC